MMSSEPEGPPVSEAAEVTGPDPERTPTGVQGGMIRQTPAGAVARLAGILSTLLHPLFLPLYGLFLIFSSRALHSFIPHQFKRMIFIVVLANNVLLPLAFASAVFARKAGRGFRAGKVNERVLLLLFALIMYSLTALLLYRMQLPNLFRAYFVGIALVTLTALLVHSFHKLSLHTAGIGGLLALIFTMILFYRIPMVWQLATLFLAGGIVSFSRIYLEEHSPAEVLTGLITGLTVMGFSLFFMLK